MWKFDEEGARRSPKDRFPLNVLHKFVTTKRLKCLTFERDWNEKIDFPLLTK